MRPLFALVLVALAARHARADDAAAQLFEEGRALLADDHVAEACAKFDASIALDGQALGTMLNLGLCNEQLDKLATSLRWYRRVAARAAELASADAEVAARAKAIELAARVPTLALAVSGAGAMVTVDGARLEALDYPRVELDAGAHVVAATAPGAVPVRVELQLADGERRTIPVALVPPAPPVEVDRGPHLRRVAYILAATGATLLAADAVVGLVARSRFEATDVRATRDRWRDTMRYVGTPVAIVGAGALAAAVYFYLRAPDARRERIAPVIAPDRVGVAVAF